MNAHNKKISADSKPDNHYDNTQHIPVLMHEVLAALNPREGDAMIDGTYGGGGHSAALLEKIGKTGKLLAIDWNEQAAGECAEQYANDKRVTCAVGNFAELPEITRLTQFPRAQGLLLDLGVSSNELEHSGRGFSFQEDEPLLMTYNDTQESVMALLRRASEEELADIIKTYGEERYATRIAHAIKERERKGIIETTGELSAVVETVAPRGGRLHPATRTFMALRIAANKELDNLSCALAHIPELVAPGGRVAIISFHSLEDRLVKHCFRELKKTGHATLITKKPFIPTRDEIRVNPRSRSAKLRALVYTHTSINPFNLSTRS